MDEKIPDIQRVAVVAREDACKRTKNRVRERGPDFVVWKSGTFEGFPAMLLIEDSPETEARDAWVGWLPVSEIIMTDRESV